MGTNIIGSIMFKGLEILKQKEELLYQLARLVRNTDGLHPSTKGPMEGSILLKLRLLDGIKYQEEVM